MSVASLERHPLIPGDRLLLSDGNGWQAPQVFHWRLAHGGAVRKTIAGDVPDELLLLVGAYYELFEIVGRFVCFPECEQLALDLLQLNYRLPRDVTLNLADTSMVLGIAIGAGQMQSIARSVLTSSKN